MAAWTKMPLGMELGISPVDFVLDGDPALPSPRKGAEPPSPIFGVFLLRPNGCMYQDATWYGGRPQPRGLCVRWGPSPLLQKMAEPPSLIFGPFLLWPNAGCIKMPIGMDVGLSPGDFVLDGDPVPSPKRERSLPPNFRPMFIVSCRTRVKRLYACAQIHYLCFSNYRIRVKYCAEFRDVTGIMCAKIDCSMFTVTVIVASFKNIVAYRRRA